MKQRKILWGDPVAFADTETSGFSYKNDRITQIAVLRVVHNLDNPLELKVEKQIEVKLDMEGYEVSEEVAKINGYDPAVWAAEAKPRKKAMQLVLPFFENAGFGGNNPSFDMNFLREEADRHRLAWPKMSHYSPWAVDSMARFLQTFGYVKNVKLATLVEFFELGEQKHDALSDIRYSVQVYQKILWIHARGLTPNVVRQAVNLKGTIQWD